MRDKIGSFLTKENVATYLNNWIASYVLLNDGASQDIKARFPLREARIDVYDVPGKPGSYRATVYLRPHFQLEELTASIRLVAALPPPAAG
jgi:type VI secretion system protein ImpC